jgi:transcriptional regulator with XRE-family HTH domain
MLLRALRSARGITQEGWAARIGVSRKTVQRWESGDVLPDARAESALLAACNELSLFLPRAAGTDERAFLTADSLRESLANARLAQIHRAGYRQHRLGHRIYSARCRAR